MKIPRKQPVQTKAQMRHAFSQFSLLYEPIETEYGYEIDIIRERSAKTVFLKRIGGAGADPCEAEMLQLIGAPNEFLQLSQEQQKRLNLSQTTSQRARTFSFVILILARHSFTDPLKMSETQLLLHSMHSFSKNARGH
jgi:hypothetical protein